MKVGLLAPEFLPNWGGAGTYSIEMARALSRIVDLHVVTLDRRVEGRPAPSGREMEKYFEDRLRVHVISRAENTFLYNARFQFQIRKVLSQLAAEEGLDLVHSQHAHMPHLYYGLRRDHLPIVIAVHSTIDGQREGIRASGIAFRGLEASEKWQVLLNPELRAVERLSLGSADRFITASRWMSQGLQAQWPSLSTPIDVIPSGVESSRFAPERARDCELLDGIDQPIVLYAARLKAAKGIHFALEAMRKVFAHHREVHFVVAGGGDSRFWRTALASHGFPDGSVTFLGYVPYDALPGLYARASIYVLPTLFEQIPLGMLEAMSCGTPVIVSGICGIPEVVRTMQNGILVPPRDSEAIASAIRLLLDDERLARTLGRQGRETVAQEFDWNRAASRTHESYRVALGESESPGDRALPDSSDAHPSLPGGANG